jgi:hypothetical protein
MSPKGENGCILAEGGLILKSWQHLVGFAVWQVCFGPREATSLEYKLDLLKLRCVQLLMLVFAPLAAFHSSGISILLSQPFALPSLLDLSAFSPPQAAFDALHQHP